MARFAKSRRHMASTIDIKIKQAPRFYYLENAHTFNLSRGDHVTSENKIDCAKRCGALLLFWLDLFVGVNVNKSLAIYLPWSVNINITSKLIRPTCKRVQYQVPKRVSATSLCSLHARLNNVCICVKHRKIMQTLHLDIFNFI